MIFKSGNKIYGAEVTSRNFLQVDTAILVSRYFALAKPRIPLSNLAKLFYETEDVLAKETQDIMLFTLNTHSIL